MNFKNTLARSLLIFVAFQSSLTLASDLRLPALCEKAVKSHLEVCQKFTKLGEFASQGKRYSVALAECEDEENQTQQYALVEMLDAQKCKVLDSDTSFIDYMYGVDADLKSKSPINVFESAIKIELSHQLKNREAMSRFLSGLREKQKIGALTKDQQWVMKYLESELKK